jgi:ElaB/YqjD/DUF883 family membrane-anchored ribosome-binding protein
MSIYPDMYARTGNWLVGAIRRKPEALLLLAAGCALMMRTARGSSSSSSPRDTRRHLGDTYGDPSRTSAGQSAVSRTREELDQTAESAADHVGDIKNQAADTASTYASAVTDYAQDARRKLSAGSERLRTQANSAFQAASGTIREQPLVIAALGLAAGVAVAALFPASDMERRTLGPAGQALAEAAGKAGENLREAAEAAGEKLKEGAAQRGLSSEGLKDFAREVAGTFTDSASGQRKSQSGAMPGSFNPSDRPPV